MRWRSYNRGEEGAMSHSHELCIFFSMIRQTHEAEHE